MADRNVASLLAFRDHPHRKAENGTHGSGKKKHGASGADTEVFVPQGTYFATVDIRPLRPDGDGVELSHSAPWTPGGHDDAG